MYDEFARRSNAIEECYEFMLAYAAQGLPGDAASQSGGELRGYLSRAAEALKALPAAALAAAARVETGSDARYEPFLAVLERDARDALAAVELVQVQPSISSQLVDNLNASIHLRALLTDLFLLDEILKPRPVGSPSTDRERS
jgi:hypothetical protein